MTPQETMLSEMKAAIYKALDTTDVETERTRLGLNAMAFAAGIASAVMEESGRKVSSATLLTAVLQSEIVSTGIDNYAKNGRPQ